MMRPRQRWSRVATWPVVLVVMLAACASPSADPANVPSGSGVWEMPTGVDTLEEASVQGTAMAQATLDALDIDNATVKDLPRGACTMGKTTADTTFYRTIGRDFTFPDGYNGDLVADIRSYWENRGADIKAYDNSTLLIARLPDQRRVWQLSLSTTQTQELGSIDITTPCKPSDNWDTFDTWTDR